MSKNTSISLGDYFENFIHERISEGRYKNTSEVIRAGLRLLEEQEEKKQLLTDALIEGERSGLVKDFDPEVLLNELHAKNNL
ncbi:MAG: type II toxin-antitoxin system ParD family antitoxin [Cyclobacteriaceae bacterium]